MTREERLDWLCRLRNFLVPFGMPNEWKAKFTQALSDSITELSEDPCSDAISRQAAIDFFKKPLSAPFIMEYLENAPSVQPIRPRGHWEYKMMEGNYCSNCGEQTIWKFDYCPNCGADMRESEGAE